MHDTNTRSKGQVFILKKLPKYIRNNILLAIQMIKKKTLVLGASPNPARYSYIAVLRLIAQGHPVVALGINMGSIGSSMIETEKKTYNDIDTVTLYLNPTHQKEYYTYILALAPKRILFNPGTENDELMELANKQGIRTQEACTLVLLSTGQY